tara:strand:+ start:1 stop:1098 length:1098 start_codon:yes stop_codon:yes gene_type:complete
MAPFKSSLAKSAGKLLGVFRQADLSLRGATQGNRYVAPPLNATVTGGNVIYTYGNYKIHVFTSSGALTVTGASRPVSFEYVLIAGGGGGGPTSGGGGAGGVISTIPGIMPVSRSALSMDVGQNVTVTVGNGGPKDGGAGQPDSPAYPGGRAGSNGFDTYYAGPGGTGTRALGGGGAGNEGATGPGNLTVPASSGGRGGSGGGSRGGRPEANDTAGIDNQGNPGSRAVGATQQGGGGGGGGGAGGGASNNIDGGIGIQLPAIFRDDSQPSAVKGDPAPGAPSPGGWYFAGGGGSRVDPNQGGATPAPYGGPTGVGGYGGGGPGNSSTDPNVNATAGQANTGGGGGGGNGPGEVGGSGIAFFYYPTA